MSAQQEKIFCLPAQTTIRLLNIFVHFFFYTLQRTSRTTPFYSSAASDVFKRTNMVSLLLSPLTTLQKASGFTHTMPARLSARMKPTPLAARHHPR